MTTAARVQQALALLEEVATDRALLADVDAETRERLQRACGAVARPDLKERKKLQKELLRRERQERKDHDEELRRQTGIRQLREHSVFPTPLPSASSPGAPQLPPHADAPPDEPPARSTEASERGHWREGPALREPRVCYVCKASYHHLHRFYDQLCPACGDVNEARRAPRHDLSGRVAIVTGARVKIGYHAAILLLRNGCHVVVTTRFPRDAVARYAREPDFQTWKDRLQVYGLDLRHTPSVEHLARHLCTSLPRLDFVIHNACQTVRRPPGFYAHLVDTEQAPASSLPPAQRRIVEAYEEFRAHDAALAGVARPALLSQAKTDADLLLPAPGVDVQGIFPTGSLDADLQQIDLRAHNSWRLGLGEVPTLELLEVLLVNAAAPFVLSSKLKPLMMRERTDDKHIVNVSAMEGQFYRAHKTDRHPHTNMAKAALNMLTRTSSMEYAKLGIWMNAVDTGWVTDEDPIHLAQQKVQEHRFSPPLDVVDGAARIVDPIFTGLQSGQHACGVFFKDYAAAPW